MSIFQTLLDKIFHPQSSNAHTFGTPVSSNEQPKAPEMPGGTDIHGATGMQGVGATEGGPNVQADRPPTVDVSAVLTQMEKQQKEKLNWKTSIVDLMKLVGMDSSLPARKELAHELGYSATTDDSAAMNLWLHKAVVKKIAENGGKIPEELLH